jgi:hypothetical protein
VWAVLHTEVFRFSPRRTWPAVIAESGLPEEVGGRIHEIVGRTGLWNRERVEVARELVAHALDASARGVDDEAIAAGLGEPRAVARLIRRAVRRKRPWLWHARVMTERAIAGVVGVAVLAAGLVAARTWLGDPRPTRNFLAELNAPVEALAEDDRAWPLYKEAFAVIGARLEDARRAMQDRAWESERRPLPPGGAAIRATTAGTDLLPSIDPAHPDYPALLELLDGFRGSLDLARAGAARPAVGMRLSTAWEEWNDQRPGWIPEPLPAPEDPAEQELLVGVLLPHLGPMRTLGRWLCFDALVALRAGDGARAAESIGATLGLGRQAGAEPFLISGLVGQALDALAAETLGRGLREFPGAFDDGTLIELAHEFGAARGRWSGWSFESESWMFEDFLQRAFTDDGRGDGHITDEGLRLLRDFESLTGENAIEETATGFARMMTLASRRELHEKNETLGALARADLAGGYEVVRSGEAASGAWARGLEQRPELAPIAIIAPHYERVVWSTNRLRARLDGVQAAVALELHRRETGAWAGSLSALAPRYLPTVPEDPFVAGPLRVTVGEGGVVVYSVGPDRDDDGGAAGGVDSARSESFFQPAGGMAPDGDWVLFPPG